MIPTQFRSETLGRRTSYGNEARPVVVFDENCVDLLLAPQANTVKNWSAWGRLIQQWPKTGSQRQHTRQLAALVNWMEAAAAEFQQSTDKFKPCPIPGDLRKPDFFQQSSLKQWLNRSHAQDRHIPNLYDAATYLLTQLLEQ